MRRPSCISVVGVSPAMDLDASVTALHRPINRLYERRFVRALLKRYRNKAACFPRMSMTPASPPASPPCADFDDRITAPYSGFASAKDYYYRASAARRVIDRIAVPTLVLHAHRRSLHRLHAGDARRPSRESAHHPSLRPRTAATAPSSARPIPLTATTAAGPRSRCSTVRAGPCRLTDAMQAEWTVECGAEDAVLVVPWGSPSDPAGISAFIDLRANPDAIDAIPEAEAHPPLMQALRSLNAARSPVFTSKCDAWEMAADELAQLRLDLGIGTGFDDERRRGRCPDPSGVATNPTHHAFRLCELYRLHRPRPRAVFASFSPPRTSAAAHCTRIGGAARSSSRNA